MTASDRDPSSAALTPRGRRTRAAVVQGAREAFEEDGFVEARIADIARRAGTSYGTFYTYFESKHEVFREVVQTTAGEMFSAVRVGDDAATPVGRIYAATDRYLAAYERNAKIMAVIEELSPRYEYFRRLLLEIRTLFVERIAASISRLQRDGLADPELDPERSAGALGGMVEHYARITFQFGNLGDRVESSILLSRLWARALGLTIQPGDLPEPKTGEATDTLAPR